MQKYRVFGIVFGVLGCVGQMHAMDESAAAVAVVSVVAADINAKDADGDTQLHKAVQIGDVGYTQQLLDLKADPNSVDAHGRTPLYYACMHWPASSVPDIRERELELVTMLYLKGAADPGCHITYLLPDVRKSIYRAGIADRVREEDWRDFWEVGNEQHPLVSYLTVPGLIRLVRDYVGVYEGVQNHPLKLRIAKHFGLEDPKRQFDDLCAACASGDMQRALRSLYLEADINGRSKVDHRIPLDIAIQYDREEIAQLLVESRARVDVHTGMGWSLLSFAAVCDRTKMVRLLLQNRASPDMQDANGSPALHAAVGWNRQELVRLLLENRANVHMQDKDGKTALHIAVGRIKKVLGYWGQKAMVQLLLEHGASIAIRDNDGKTPLDFWKETRERAGSCVVS